MNEVKFNHHRVDSRKDLLHFVEEHLDKQVYKHIGENPEAWIDELNLINLALTRNSLSCASGFNHPPLEDLDFKELGNGAFFYRGSKNKLRGLWIKKDYPDNLEDMSKIPFYWDHYQMGTRADLRINSEFSDVPIEKFFPENFEKVAQKVEKDKRPLFTFPIQVDGKKRIVYAKGADTTLSHYYEYSKPKYRLTSICGISKTTSKEEMETTLNLRNIGVNVPRVIGYYESSIEEFLFLEKVAGKQPNKMLQEHKGEIIRQDAEMLAALCLSGYRKMGFPDFDDKIFDGTNLYLIDVDECRDLYFLASPDFRKILLNPQKPKDLQKFRKFQRDFFIGALRDALYEYQDSLTPTDFDKRCYVGAFYNKLGWKNPQGKKMEQFLDFPEDYQTYDSYMSMMCDTD